MEKHDEGLWGVIIYESNKEYYYHTLRAEKYEDFRDNVGKMRINFLTGKNNLNEEMIKEYIIRARKLILKMRYDEASLEEELQKFNS